MQNKIIALVALGISLFLGSSVMSVNAQYNDYSSANEAAKIATENAEYLEDISNMVITCTYTLTSNYNLCVDLMEDLNIKLGSVVNDIKYYTLK